jgi:hypothetical protein
MLDGMTVTDMGADHPSGEMSVDLEQRSVLKNFKNDILSRENFKSIGNGS